MPLDFMRDCTFVGPALPEPFVRFDLEGELAKAGLLPKTSGAEAAHFQESWVIYRGKLRELVSGGTIRVRHQVVEPLIERMGFGRIEDGTQVQTREGQEDGGDLLVSSDNTTRLRFWCTEYDEDLDAPARRGAAYRYSHVRIAQRVLLACGERLGLLTNGTELRILISDPARPDSQIIINIDPAWRDKRSFEVPDSYRLLVALASPKGIQTVSELVEKARLQQTRVTKELRRQAREAVEAFLQEVLNHPANQEKLRAMDQRPHLARELWREALIIVYRLLFILKLESTDDPARSFSFSSTSLWRNTFSPSVALPPFVRKLLDHGSPTGKFLESAIRGLFRMFVGGLDCTELHVRPLGGTLFGEKVTLLLTELHWGEHGVALLLDRLLWTAPKRGTGRERVHYGSLDVEDLGRVYEALLELEPGIATEPMCRLRRAKLEVVVPIAQGENYRPAGPPIADEQSGGDEDAEEESEEEEADEPTRRGKTKVEWVEEIQPGCFYLRVGLGRKATGSYYTPHSFVRFLVQETLGPLVSERSPEHDPRPAEILKLKVLDPAMGSGHFLVEACRFLGAKLYESVRLCDERLAEAETIAAAAKIDEDRQRAETRITDYRRRINAFLPPDAELLAYLPSRSPEAAESGLSQKRAEAICRRLVAIHCLYGVDKNPLAVELAKVSLWIESHAEGLPLTFLDHRLVLGDSTTGPFFQHLLTYPGSKQAIEDLYTQMLPEKLTDALTQAISLVRDIESTLGVTIGDLEIKQTMRQKLDAALAPFRVVAAAWAGGVMLESGCDDDAYRWLVAKVANTGNLPEDISSHPRLVHMIALGIGCESVPIRCNDIVALLNTDSVNALGYEYAFPEVFYRFARLDERSGFDVILGNPPWDAIQFKSKEFLASYNAEILNAPTQRERRRIEQQLLEDPRCSKSFEEYQQSFEARKRCNDRLYSFQKIYIDGVLAGRQLDEFRVFMERNMQLLRSKGRSGVVVPSAFHANEGATGIRRLYLDNAAISLCYSFENRRKLFEIDSRFKFALVIANAGEQTHQFSCAFYLHDDEWLFSDRNSALSYTKRFVEKTGRKYLNFVEARTQKEVEILDVFYSTESTLADYSHEFSINLQGPPAALHMSHESHRFVPVERLSINHDVRLVLELSDELKVLPLIEGKHFWHYDYMWGDPPRYFVPAKDASDLRAHLFRARHYQLVVRAVASSTNERTIVASLLPPGVLVGHSVLIDSSAGTSSYSHVLALLAALNTYSFDWLARQQVGTNVTLFVLRGLPLPAFGPAKRFLVHSALRLQGDAPCYQPLWDYELAGTWREDAPREQWRGLDSTNRVITRSAIDAAVATMYGLSREQYERVLSGFKHTNPEQTKRACLDRFDEIGATGFELFARRYDPYWDVPLNESSPEPVIAISLPESEPERQGMLALMHGGSEVSTHTRRIGARHSNSQDTDAYERVRQLLTERLLITNSDVQSMLGYDADYTRILLKNLVEDGVAVVEGSGRATRYVARPGAGHVDTAE